MKSIVPRKTALPRKVQQSDAVGFPILLATLFCLIRSEAAVLLSTPTIQSDRISFSFDSAADQLLTVQSAVSLSSPEWLDVARYPGTGSAIHFSTPITVEQRFFRVSVSTIQPLHLTPDAPALPTGAISLPDAVTGAAYAQEISPLSTGLAPYTVQINGAPPDGMTLTISDNGTANALVRVVSTGGGLTADQRRQFEVTVVDSLNATNIHQYDLRVVTPPPQIISRQLVFKAGETTSLKLISEGGTGTLSWSLASGLLPTGVNLLPEGLLTGKPSTEAAELNETGRYTNVIEAADSFTDRVTGAPSPRKATQAVESLVRLSYLLNIRAPRPNGPSLQQTCYACHGPGFSPDFETESALALVSVKSGSGSLCGTDRVYIAPGDIAGSLIYQKLSDQPPCGDRMPFGGPYFTPQRLERLARWIRELTASDID